MYKCDWCDKEFETKFQMYGHRKGCEAKPQGPRGLAKFWSKITGAEPQKAYPKPIIKRIKALEEAILSLRRASKSQGSAIKSLLSASNEPQKASKQPTLSLEAESALEERIVHQLHAIECTEVEDNTKRISAIESEIKQIRAAEKAIEGMVTNMSVILDKKRSHR